MSRRCRLVLGVTCMLAVRVGSAEPIATDVAASGVPRARLTVSASTWREGKQPHDIRSEVERSLQDAGCLLVGESSDDFDVALAISYREDRGDVWTQGTGTRITCRVRAIEGRTGRVLWDETMADDLAGLVGLSNEGDPSEGLYEMALGYLQTKIHLHSIGQYVLVLLGRLDQSLMLTSALQTSDVRWNRLPTEAAMALREMGPTGIGLLAAAVSHPAYLVRRVSLKELAKVAAPPPEVLAALTSGMGDANAWNRIEAAKAYWQASRDAAKPVAVLSQILHDEHQPYSIWAAQALGDMGVSAKDSIPALEQAERDEDPAVREAATAAVGKIRKQPE